MNTRSGPTDNKGTEELGVKVRCSIQPLSKHSHACRVE